MRIRVDNALNRAIIEVRSSEGQVIRQYPTEAQLRAFARAESLKSARQHEENAQLNAELASADTTGVSAPQGQADVQQAAAAPAPTSVPASAAPSAPAPDSGPASGGASTQSIEV